MADDGWLSTRNRFKVSSKSKVTKKGVTGKPVVKSKSCFLLTQNSPSPKQAFTATKQSTLGRFFTVSDKEDKTFQKPGVKRKAMKEEVNVADGEFFTVDDSYIKSEGSVIRDLESAFGKEYMDSENVNEQSDFEVETSPPFKRRKLENSPPNAEHSIDTGNLKTKSDIENDTDEVNGNSKYYKEEYQCHTPDSIIGNRDIKTKQKRTASNKFDNDVSDESLIEHLNEVNADDDNDSIGSKEEFSDDNTDNQDDTTLNNVSKYELFLDISDDSNDQNESQITDPAGVLTKAEEIDDSDISDVSSDPSSLNLYSEFTLSTQNDRNSDRNMIEDLKRIENIYNNTNFTLSSQSAEDGDDLSLDL